MGTTAKLSSEVGALPKNCKKHFQPTF